MQPDTSQTHHQVSGIPVRPNSSTKQFTNIPSISHGDQVMATTSMYLMIFFWRNNQDHLSSAETRPHRRWNPQRHHKCRVSTGKNACGVSWRGKRCSERNNKSCRTHMLPHIQARSTEVWRHKKKIGQDAIIDEPHTDEGQRPNGDRDSKGNQAGHNTKSAHARKMHAKCCINSLWNLDYHAMPRSSEERISDPNHVIASLCSRHHDEVQTSDIRSAHELFLFQKNEGQDHLSSAVIKVSKLSGPHIQSCRRSQSEGERL